MSELIQTIIPAGRSMTPEYIKYDQLFSPPECLALQQAGAAAGFVEATIGGGDGDARIDKNIRCVLTANIVPRPDLQWFFKRLADRVEWTNNDRYHFDLVGLTEGANVLRYDAPQHADEVAGHYDMHQDIGSGQMSLRKLSVVVQLSDPADYDGGRLHLISHRDLEVAEVKQGDVIIFPSYVPHYVTPVTRGTRFAIASWVSGPPFR